MNKFISIFIICLVVLGIIGFLYLNIAEYSCDSVEVEKDGALYQNETCCRYLGFSCYTQETALNK
ncbi:MAG: hypothetical protein ACR2NC_00105 [Thermodesulfobacteriota bacterium]